MGKNKKKGDASQQAKYVQAIAEIVQALIRCYETKSPINMSKLKGRISKKYALANSPKIVDVISALPDSHREKLLPYLKVKPIRTASGVAVVGKFLIAV